MAHRIIHTTDSLHKSTFRSFVFYPTEELFFVFNYLFSLLDGILYKPMTLQQDSVSSPVFVEFYKMLLYIPSSSIAET